MELLSFHPNNQEKNKTILFIGVFHGDEPQGQFLIEKFIQTIDIHKLKNKLLFIPCLNTFGKKHNLRTNENGVDLNRNFNTKNWQLSEKNEFFSGPSPNSEKQTQFLTNIIEQQKLDCILSLHAPFKIVNYDGPQSFPIAKKISQLINYPLQKDIGYPTFGSFGTFCGIERHIPTITLELEDNKSNQYLWDLTKNIFNFLSYQL